MSDTLAVIEPATEAVLTEVPRDTADAVWPPSTEVKSIYATEG